MLDTILRAPMDGLQSGVRAFFEPRPAKQEGRTPIGVAVVLKGQELTGWVAHVPAGKPYCFIEPFDPSDNKRELFHYFGDNPDQLREEEEVRLVVSENAKGPVAIEVRRFEGSSPQAA